MSAAVLAEFHFLRPLWLLALAALPLAFWLRHRRRRRDNPWRRVVDAHLLAALVEPAPAAGRRLRTGWLWLLPVLAVLALAGPAWRQVPQPLLRSESALVVALDLSARMAAADLSPNRLARARFKVADLLRARPDGQIGLIAYAGDAFTVAPLTNDGATLEALLAALSPEVMPVPGQRADRAIERAAALIHDAGFADGRVLLLTDRADAAAIDAARQAAAGGVHVSVLGVGTAQGAPVPLAGGSFASDDDGKPLMAALDRDSLQRLAAAGDGRYAAITADGSDLAALDVLGGEAGNSRRADDAERLPRYRDEGPWLLVLLLPLAALTFRRGWLGCLPLLLFVAPRPAAAFDWQDLWQRPEQQAQQALEQGDYDRARALAKAPERLGSAAYKAGDFAVAAQAFAEGDGADADYNRGNALARAGQLEQALDAYDAALAAQPDMADAIANRDAVRRALEQQKQQQQQQQNPQNGDQGEQQKQSGQSSPQQGDGQSSDDTPSSSQQGSQPQDDGSKPSQARQGEQQDDGAEQPAQDGDSEADQQAREQQQKSLSQAIDQATEHAEQQGEQQPAPAPESQEEQEARQASEQMLRRVPDDPGGLLRRKFALEYRQRAAEGQGDDR